MNPDEHFEMILEQEAIEEEYQLMLMREAVYEEEYAYERTA